MAGAPKGNRNAANKRQFECALNAALNKDRGALVEIASTLVDRAKAGESWAIQMVADRLDGKPKQQHELTGKDDEPIRHEFDLSGMTKKALAELTQIINDQSPDT